MDERFLHYIWKFQKFSKAVLTDTLNKKIVVFNQGQHNHNSGPDFEEANIKIGEVQWVGSVEIHINSSDWRKHNHQHNKAYHNVILHVVWNDDEPLRLNRELIPTLELKHLVNPATLGNYQKFIQQNKEILCADQLPAISSLTFSSLLDRRLVERLEQKAQLIAQFHLENSQDWESTAYHSLAKNFGFSLNAEPFALLAKVLPKKIVSKYYGNTKSTEALVFGQAGFLQESNDPYQTELKKEYEYLKSKHRLEPKITKEMWKFGRMRPANFPTVRLAQFASILSNNQKLFSNLIESTRTEQLVNKFQIELNDYWVLHYDFGKKKKKQSSMFGQATTENILINTVAPLLAAYCKYVGDHKYMEQAMQLLEHLKPENNSITKKWAAAGKHPSHAFDSQALIGLYKNYCTKKNCLNCSIGIEILSR